MVFRIPDLEEDIRFNIRSTCYYIFRNSKLNRVLKECSCRRSLIKSLGQVQPAAAVVHCRDQTCCIRRFKILAIDRISVSTGCINLDQHFFGTVNNHRPIYVGSQVIIVRSGSAFDHGIVMTCLQKIISGTARPGDGSVV